MYEIFCGWHLPKTAKLAIKAMFFGLLWPFVTTETNVIPAPVDILFLLNQNIHKSSSGHCFWTSDPLIERF